MCVSKGYTPDEVMLGRFMLLTCHGSRSLPWRMNVVLSDCRWTSPMLALLISITFTNRVCRRHARATECTAGNNTITAMLPSRSAGNVALVDNPLGMLRLSR